MPIPGDNGSPALEKKQAEERINEVANKGACVQKEVKLVPLDYIIDFCNTVTDWEAIYEETRELPAKDDCYSCKIEEQ